MLVRVPTHSSKLKNPKDGEGKKEREAGLGHHLQEPAREACKKGRLSKLTDLVAMND